MEKTIVQETAEGLRKRQLEYWKNRKLNLYPGNGFLRLFLRSMPSEVPDPVLRSVRIPISRQTSEQIMKVCNESDISIFILLVALVKSVVARYQHESEVSIVSPGYKNNPKGKIVDLILLQDKVLLHGSLRENILETKTTVIGAYSNQEYFLSESLVDGLSIADTKALLLDNVFCTLNTIHTVSLPSATPFFGVNFSRNEGDISCELSFDAGTYSSDLIEGFCESLCSFIAAACMDFSRSPDSLPLMTEESFQKVLHWGKGHHTEFPQVTLHELFEMQVARTPDAKAIALGEQSLSFSALNRQAEEVAKLLVMSEVKQGDNIVLVFSRSLEMIAAIIGVMKAGASFVPLDPNEPVERMSQMLKDAAPKLLLTNKPTFQLPGSLPIVNLAFPLSEASADIVLPSVDNTAKAYIIFTSGTTGIPKGVVVSHRAIVNAVHWRSVVYAQASEEPSLLLFAYNFDGFILNLFSPLISGTHVILADDRSAVNPASIIHLLHRYPVSHLTTTPVLFHAILEAGRDAKVSDTLKRVTVAGDAMNINTLLLSKKIRPELKISNEYGPTENAVVATFYDDIQEDSVKVIGRPINNVNILVLDSRRNPTPVGVFGELCISGDGLAEGYLNDHLHADSAFDEYKGERMYATGDMVRWVADGNLEFKGRSNEQIKLRGFRIDLNEIRKALLRHPAVHDAIVVLDGVGSEASMVACFSADSDIIRDDLHQSMAEWLPVYMIPHQYFRVEELPLTNSGKYDIAALKAAIHMKRQGEGQQLPENDIESKLLRIWQRILKIENIGVNQNFFSLGGHSLKATRLLSEIHNEFKVDLLLNQVFVTSTIRELAVVITASLGNETDEIAMLPVSDKYLPGAAQKRMLVMHEMANGNMSYNIPMAFESDQDIDLKKLEEGIRILIERHEVLRAGFLIEDREYFFFIGDVRQLFLKEVLFPSSHNIGEQIQTLLSPFDLAEPPLFRVFSIKCNTGERYLVFDFHHIIVDERSIAIFFDELKMHYEGLQLAPLTVTYKDYAAWRNKIRESASYEKKLSYWNDKLKGKQQHFLNLPFDFPNANRLVSYPGARVTRKLGLITFESLHSFCTEYQCTNFMLMSAVLSVFLYKLTGQGEIIFGTPVSERSHPATRDMMGLFLNTIPVFQTVTPQTQFIDFLQTVKAQLLEYLQYADVEFDDIVRTLSVEREPGKHPFFNLMLAIVDNDISAFQLGNAGLKEITVHNGTAKFDLTIEVRTAEDGIMLEFEYSTGLFLEDTIKQMLDCFIVLLENILRHPASTISDLRILTGSGEAELMRFGTGLYNDAVIRETTISIFENNVRLHPDAVALIWQNQTMSYDALNRAANKLAVEIRKYTRTGDPVVLLLERSFYTVIAMLAVQKVGAVYVPVDVTYPANRINNIITSSNSRLLVTDQRALTDTVYHGDVIYVDSPDIALNADDNLLSDVTPASPLYVLYTSGTTGMPKGVSISHCNIVNLVKKVTPAFGVGHDDTWTMFHTYCFDAAAWEMYASLLTGGKLVIVPISVAKNPSEFADLLHAQRVTMMSQPPSSFYNLIDELTSRPQGIALRYVILGGEAVKLYKLKKWFGYYHANIINGYGITETTVYSSFKNITAYEVDNAINSIGKPIASNYMYILDVDMHVSPIGVTGEIYVGGLAVGYGYVGNPEMTAQRFIPDPFRPGAMLYKTGDLARWKPNGEIEYASRIDHQVKIRGYRVETTELEVAMSRYPGIKDIVISTIESDLNGLQLVAYFVSHVQQDTTAIRKHIEQYLPYFMVPAYLLQVDSIPYSTNGKVDRKKLPDPKKTFNNSVMENVAISPMEQLLKGVWSDILGLPVEQIGINDKFFLIGGDSISAHLVIRKLNNLNFDATLVDLFENDTIASFVAHIRPQHPDAIVISDSVRKYWKHIAGQETTYLPRKKNYALSAGNIGHISLELPYSTLSAIINKQANNVSLDQLLLTCTGMALRLWTGEDEYRFDLLKKTGVSDELLVCPGLLTIRDINDFDSNLRSVSDCLEQAEQNYISVPAVFEDPELEPLVFSELHYRLMSASNDDHRRDLPEKMAEQAGEGMYIAGTYSATALSLQIFYHESLGEKVVRMFSENFQFCLKQLTGFFEKDASSSIYSSQVLHDVTSFNDVFFRNCAYQSQLTAIRYYGRQYRLFVANTIPVYVRDEASRNVRFKNDYLTERTDEALHQLLGMKTELFFYSHDICNALIHHLSAGALLTVHIDCFYVSAKKELYQKKHGGHVMLVLGYDAEAKIFHVIDNQASLSTNYQRNTISFDELRVAYEGYNEVFNPQRNTATMVVLHKVNPTIELRDEDIRKYAVNYLKTSGERLKKSRNVVEFISKNVAFLFSDTQLLSESIIQLNSVFGELVNAKKIELYKTEVILADEEMTDLMKQIVQHLEYIRNVLTKMEVSRVFLQSSYEPVITRIEQILVLEDSYINKVNDLK